MRILTVADPPLDWRYTRNCDKIDDMKDHNNILPTPPPSCCRQLGLQQRNIFSFFLKYSLTFFLNWQKTSDYALSRLKLLFLFNVKMCRKFRIKFASYSNQFQNSFGNLNHLYFGKSWTQRFSFLYIHGGETRGNCHCSRKTKVQISVIFFV